MPTIVPKNVPDVTGASRVSGSLNVTGTLNDWGAALDRRFPRVPGLFLRIRYLGLHTFVVDRRFVGALLGGSVPAATLIMARVPATRRRPVGTTGGLLLAVWAVVFSVDRLRWGRRGLRLRIPTGRFAEEVAAHLQGLGYEARAVGPEIHATIPIARVRAVSLTVDDLLRELDRTGRGGADGAEDHREGEHR